MKITTLLENTSISNEFINKHGLCLHIETANHKILFDLGPDDSFIHNAKKLNVDLAQVDIVVISHGHSDHGGGLAAFLELNKSAMIYVSDKAFEEHYYNIAGIVKKNIGLDKSLENNPRIVKTCGVYKIDDELTLFSDISGTQYLPSSNRSLYAKANGRYGRDKFLHEQNLIINDGSHNVLFAGCAHRGIVNTLEAAIALADKIDFAISGMHLYNPSTKKQEKPKIVDGVGKALLLSDTSFYTCHCTGAVCYNRLKVILKDRINYLSTGITISI